MIAKHHKGLRGLSPPQVHLKSLLRIHGADSTEALARLSSASSQEGPQPILCNGLPYFALH